MKLTQALIDKIVAALPGDGKLHADDDLPRFYVRPGKTNVSYIVQYEVGGSARRMVIGNSTIMPLAKARETAKEILARVKLGDDPLGAKQAAQAEAAMKRTFGELVPEFIKAKSSGNKPRSASTLRDYDRYLMRYAEPLHRKAIDEVKRQYIASMTSKVETKHGSATALAFSRSMSSFLGWCVRKGLTEVNAAENAERPDKADPRERTLTGDEIVAVWKATTGDDDFSRIVRLLLLTGQRRDEFASLAWAEVDLENRVITFDKARVKNRSQHVLPMSGPVHEILSGVQKREGTEYVFGRSEGPFSGFSRALKNLHQASGTSGWTLHDLRRTFSTEVVNLGINPWVVESVLNHLPQGSARSYNYSKMTGDKLVALDKWANHVLTLAGEAESNVVKLPGKRRAS